MYFSFDHAVSVSKYSPEQLQKMVPIVCKVVAQMPCFHVYEDFVARRFCAGQVEESLRAIVHNATLDSALISLRCFNEFLKQGGREDDVRSRHFPVPTPMPFLTREEENSIHKYLAHLTLTRMDLVATPWLIDSMVLRGLQAGIQFLGAVDTGFPMQDQNAKTELDGVLEACKRLAERIAKRAKPSTP